MTGALIALAVVLLIAGLTYWFYRRLKALKPEVDAAKQAFLDEVGYPFGGVMALHAQQGPTPVSTPEGFITHRSDTRIDGDAQVTTQSWVLVPNQTPPATFQLIEKKLVSGLQKLKNVVGPVAKTVTVQFPGPHLIGDAELDARFALYASEPQPAALVLRRHDVKSELLSLAEVVLMVEPAELQLADPADQNLWAAYAAAGLSKAAINPAPMIRVSISVHQSVHRALRAIARR